MEPNRSQGRGPPTHCQSLLSEVPSETARRKSSTLRGSGAAGRLGEVSRTLDRGCCAAAGSIQDTLGHQHMDSKGTEPMQTMRPQAHMGHTDSGHARSLVGSQLMQLERRKYLGLCTWTSAWSPTGQPKGHCGYIESEDHEGGSGQVASDTLLHYIFTVSTG